MLTYELLTGASPFTVEGEKNNQQEISRYLIILDFVVFQCSIVHITPMD